MRNPVTAEKFTHLGYGQGQTLTTQSAISPALSLCEQRRAGACLLLDVVCNHQRINLIEDLGTAGVFRCKLVVKLVETIDLAAEDFSADAVAFGVVAVLAHRRLQR